MRRIKLYYRLGKPGIVYGNALTAAAGFFLASERRVDWITLVMMLVGISLTIAGACVFNNYLDRELDARMERTKNRALVTGEISAPAALGFGFILLLAGSAALFFYTNLLTLSISLLGVGVYVIVYGWAKRFTPLGVHIGAIAGAVPPLVGYTAVSNHLDAAGLALFMLVFVWQMPHFFSIGMYRSKEYEVAGVYVLFHRLGVFRAKLLIFIYVLLFACASWVLWFAGLVSYPYAWVMSVVCAGWIMFALQGFFNGNEEADNNVWARRMFLYSLLTITLLSLVLILG